MATFQLPHNTSAHYIIGRDGTVVQLVQEGMGAFHVSCYDSRSYCVPTCPICDLNRKFVQPYTQSIGIELVNDGHVDQPSTAACMRITWIPELSFLGTSTSPIAALKILVTDIRARWHIPWDMVMGHYRINKKMTPVPR